MTKLCAILSSVFCCLALVLGVLGVLAAPQSARADDDCPGGCAEGEECQSGVCLPVPCNNPVPQPPCDQRNPNDTSVKNCHDLSFISLCDASPSQHNVPQCKSTPGCVSCSCSEKVWYPGSATCECQ
jgi:hypothetical protein